MFRRSILTLALAAAGSFLVANHATAQDWRFQFHSGGWPSHTRPQVDHHVQPHRPDVAALDRYSDQLSKIVRHLHEDAHDLSQDYHHSAAIEEYVSQLDDLKQHMHEMLHQASRHGTYSTALDRHLKRDLQEVKRLLYALDGELAHQTVDGTRARDFRAIQHMREVVLTEAYPWVQLMESALYGAGHDHLHSRSSIHRDTVRPRGLRSVVPQPRFERSVVPRSTTRFRFSF